MIFGVRELICFSFRLLCFPMIKKNHCDNNKLYAEFRQKNKMARFCVCDPLTFFDAHL